MKWIVYFLALKEVPNPKVAVRIQISECLSCYMFCLWHCSYYLLFLSTWLLNLVMLVFFSSKWYALPPCCDISVLFPKFVVGFKLERLCCFSCYLSNLSLIWRRMFIFHFLGLLLLLILVVFTRLVHICIILFFISIFCFDVLSSICRWFLVYTIICRSKINKRV